MKSKEKYLTVALSSVFWLFSASTSYISGVYYLTQIVRGVFDTLSPSWVGASSLIAGMLNVVFYEVSAMLLPVVRRSLPVEGRAHKMVGRAGEASFFAAITSTILAVLGSSGISWINELRNVFSAVSVIMLLVVLVLNLSALREVQDSVFGGTLGGQQFPRTQG